MVSRAIPFPFPPIEAQPSEALPPDPFKAFHRVKQATLVPMIHPVLSTYCGSEASPPHVPIHGSKL